MGFSDARGSRGKSSPGIYFAPRPIPPSFLGTIMPLTHTTTFRARFYECDAYGHLNHATYLRYMQEAAFDASAAAGYDMDYYEQVAQQWLIRETKITYLQPVLHQQSLDVTTWVGDFRRVRSRRMYEMRLAGTERVMARGYTDWVYVDSRTFRPVMVPEEMMRTFLPEGGTAQGDKREAFPRPPAPPSGVFTLRQRVLWRDLDPARHVNNANYVAFTEDAGIQILYARNWSIDRMTAAGFGIVAREYHIEYLLPAVLNDQLEIATWLSDVRRATAVRHYTITRVGDGVLLARARALWVWVDLQTGMPIRIPADFAADFAGNIATT